MHIPLAGLDHQQWDAFGILHPSLCLFPFLLWQHRASKPQHMDMSWEPFCEPQPSIHLLSKALLGRWPHGLQGWWMLALRALFLLPVKSSCPSQLL